MTFLSSLKIYPRTTFDTMKQLWKLYHTSLILSHVPSFLYHTLLCPGVIWRNLKSDQFRYKVKRDFDCSGDRKVGPLGISTWIIHQWALTPYLENSQNYWKYIENIPGEFRKLRTYVYPAWPHKTRIKILRNRNRNMTLLPALPSPSTT